jgi:hypothetical protein
VTREERIGMNEAVFRDVNERIQDVASTFDLTSEPLDLICECGDAACVDRISLTREEYEQVRAGAHLANRPGYDIVRKYKGVPAEIATKTDPRADK